MALPPPLRKRPVYDMLHYNYTWTHPMADQPHHHNHGHERAHAARPASRVAERLSLLRMSAGQRLLGAAMLCAILWLGVWWALT